MPQQTTHNGHICIEYAIHELEAIRLEKEIKRIANGGWYQRVTTSVFDYTPSRHIHKRNWIVSQGDSTEQGQNS